MRVGPFFLSSLHLQRKRVDGRDCPGRHTAADGTADRRALSRRARWQLRQRSVAACAPERTRAERMHRRCGCQQGDVRSWNTRGHRICMWTPTTPWMRAWGDATSTFRAAPARTMPRRRLLARAVVEVRVRAAPATVAAGSCLPILDARRWPTTRPPWPFSSWLPSYLENPGHGTGRLATERLFSSLCCFPLRGWAGRHAARAHAGRSGVCVLVPCNYANSARLPGDFSNHDVTRVGSQHVIASRSTDAHCSTAWDPLRHASGRRRALSGREAGDYILRAPPRHRSLMDSHHQHLSGAHSRGALVAGARCLVGRVFRSSKMVSRWPAQVYAKPKGALSNRPTGGPRRNRRRRGCKC